MKKINIGVKNMDNKDVIFEVSEEKYNEMKAKGIDDDAILKPGNHIFKRVSPDKVFARKDTKTRINICIDSDILQHFRNRAENPNAAPYQTQINAELRAIMEKDLANNTPLQNNVEDITKNKEFVRAVAEQLKELLAA
jgi:uncharacterized protein (DUF4415 family)